MMSLFHRVRARSVAAGAAVASLVALSACAVGTLLDTNNAAPLPSADGSAPGPLPSSADGGVMRLDGGTIDPPHTDAGPDAPHDIDASGVVSDAAPPPPPPLDASDDAPTLDSGTGDGSAFDSGSQVTLTISIDPNSTEGRIGPGFVGLSYEKLRLQQGLFRGDNTPLLALFNLLGPSVLRIGGSSQDQMTWLPTGGGGPSSVDGGASVDAGAGDATVLIDGAALPSYITPSEVDGLASFAKAAGWKVIYGLNMQSASPEVAQSESTYVANALGGALSSFEIGNSPDLYSGIAAQLGSWSPNAFTNEWSVFQSAIAQTTPGSLFAGPSATGPISVWTAPFAIAEAQSLSLLTQHYYIGSGLASTATVARMLVPDPLLLSNLDALRAAQALVPGSPPFRIDQCNTYDSGGPASVMTSFASALWAIDFLFTNAKYGSSGVNFHGDGNLSGYAPIADVSGSVTGVRSMFYGMLLFAKAGQGVLEKTTVNSTTLNFNAYAVGSSNGNTSVVLSNKDRTTTVQASIDIGKLFTTAGSMLLTAPSVTSTSGVTFGGATVSSGGTFAANSPTPLTKVGTTVFVSVPPGSAVLVTVQQ